MTLKNLAVIALLCAAGPAAWTTRAATADEAAVNKTIAAYVEAFNQKDVKKIGGLWRAEGAYTDRGAGDRLQGRKAIQADLAANFKANPASRLAGAVDRFRLIRPDVAHVTGETILTLPDSETVN